jgi:hypothetical protein
MIPAFLHSLAALLRRLIAEGRAVHCTEADAAELELLAGLFEQHGPIAYLREPSKEWLAKAGITTAEISAERVDITPADIAFGWLKMAGGTGKLWNGPHLVVDGGLLNEDGQRIAVRAELAVLANRELVVQAYERYIQTEEKQDLSPGTIEGARAAWSFVVWSIQNAIVSNREVEAQISSGHKLMEQLGCYRRELEAMK